MLSMANAGKNTYALPSSRKHPSADTICDLATAPNSSSPPLLPLGWMAHTSYSERLSRDRISSRRLRLWALHPERRRRPSPSPSLVPFRALKLPSAAILSGSLINEVALILNTSIDMIYEREPCILSSEVCLRSLFHPCLTIPFSHHPSGSAARISV
jgi:hypothetical protein